MANPLDFNGTETPNEINIILGFRAMEPLDMRRRESLYIIADTIWHNCLPHLLSGDIWDPDMQRVLRRVIDSYEPNNLNFSKNPNVHWNGPVRLAIAPHVTKFDKYYYDLRVRLTQLLWVTQQFHKKFPQHVDKPSSGIRHKALGAAGQMPSITRFNHCWTAYETQQPNEYAHVPDPRLFPPPSGVRPVGTAAMGKAAGIKLGNRHGEDDALANNFEHSGMPAPTVSEHGGQYSDEYREAWIEGYREAYQTAHSKRRGIIEGTKAGRTRAEHDTELGAPPLEFDAESPHEIEQITGKPRAYISNYDEHYILAYREAYRRAPGGSDGPDDGGAPGDEGGGPDDGGSPGGGGPIDSPDDHGGPSGGGPSGGGPGDGPGPGGPGPADGLRSESYRALSKCLAYYERDDIDQANEWAQELFGLLRDAGLDVA